MTTRPFEQAVTDHGPAVLRVCRAVLDGHDDAADAWSETFLTALRAWPELPESTNIQAWLVTVAHRKAVDITRARARHATPVEQLPERVSRVGIPGTGDRDLWDAVAALPTKQRQAVAYHYFGGLPHKDVAELIGGSTDAVRRAAADGIKTLRITYTSPGSTKRSTPHDN